MISAYDACEMAGITYRQFDYWTRCGVLPYGSTPGSGRRREIPNEDIDRLRALGAVCRAFGAVVGERGGNKLTHAVLRAVFENYFEGHVAFDDGIILAWPVAVLS